MCEEHALVAEVALFRALGHLIQVDVTLHAREQSVNMSTTQKAKIWCAFSRASAGGMASSRKLSSIISSLLFLHTHTTRQHARCERGQRNEALVRAVRSPHEAHRVERCNARVARHAQLVDLGNRLDLHSLRQDERLT